jgi:hypothetical protein
MARGLTPAFWTGRNCSADNDGRILGWMRTWLGTGLVAAVVGSVVAACAVAAVGRAAADGASARVGSLAFAYPSRFAHLDLPGAVIVADYPLSKNSPTVRSATFPRNGVLFMLNREPKLQPPIAAPAVAFPLSLRSLGRSHHRPNGQTWERRFQLKGSVYGVTVWLGNASSKSDRATIASVLASVHRTP